MGDERDRKMADEPDVEAHKRRLHSEEAEKAEGKDSDDDEPDVEAHFHKNR